jgi:hypothetical protein
MRYSGKVGYNGVDTSLPTQHGTKQKSFGAPYNGKGDVCGVLLDTTAHTLTFLKNGTLNDPGKSRICLH